MNQQSLRELIERTYPQMTPQIQRAAKYVLASPKEIALYPMRTIAQRARVSPSALVRLASQLGFDSYNELRNLFREEISLGDGPSRYAASAGELIAAQDSSQVTDRAQKAVTNMLSLTAGLFDQDFMKEIEAAAATMMDCPTIHLIAFRNNHAPAFFFYYVVRLLRKGVVLVDSSHGMLIDALSAVEPGDCALVISYEPYAKDAVNAANLAREAGAKIIAITDSPVSPIGPSAAHVLVTPRLDVSFYQSSIPTIAVLEALIYFIVARSGPDAVERVSREFERLASQGAYWDEHRKTS